MLTVQALNFLLLVLAAIGTALKRGRPFVARHTSSIFRISVAAVFLLSAYWAFAQYLAWLSGETTRYLLPPYQSINYFLLYVGARFFGPYVLSLFIAIAAFYAARWYNARKDWSLFYDEEYYFIALSIFLVGHPYWIAYALILPAVAGLIIGFRYLILRKTDKFSLYYLWFPVAALVILITGWLQGIDAIGEFIIRA
jgi:hypothetical protein